MLPELKFDQLAGETGCVDRMVAEGGIPGLAAALTRRASIKRHNVWLEDLRKEYVVGRVEQADLKPNGIRRRKLCGFALFGFSQGIECNRGAGSKRIGRQHTHRIYRG